MDGVDHEPHQSATETRVTARPLHGSSDECTGARSAWPTGLPHVALLLPVDAVASSRPSWPYIRLRCAELISGR
ncbi:hypothetical protein FM106_27475 [Brachybacterium faecium]|nr:hypothetical protein FM106_27475 [Brachybacterium faecium]